MNKSDILFNWICDAPFDTKLKIPDVDKERYDKGITLMNHWQSGGNFQVLGFCIAFDQEMKSFVKLKSFKK